MEQTQYQGGENFNLRTMLQAGRSMRCAERVRAFAEAMDGLRRAGEVLYQRVMLSPADREMLVLDPFSGQARPMLMFGSNNYLGLANHPHVRERVRRAMEAFGIGMGGPPLLNGTTVLHRELEERLAALKGTEDALLFSSGYGANVGLVSGLTVPGDCFIYDVFSHASLCDGLRLAGVSSKAFPHNDVEALERVLAARAAGGAGDVFVGVEGVYSMDGDLAPLPGLVARCRAHGAILVLDDAHGTGVMGRRGSGTAEHHGVEGSVDVTMGTFSKTFGVAGGFVAASRPLVEYLRYFARSHMFSASLPPVVAAAVHAGLDILEREPGRVERLRENVRYACAALRDAGFEADTPSAILALRVPESLDIRRAARTFHELGVFVNAIEYPAVPVREQRFRISFMATHTRSDIDRLVDAAQTVWALRRCRAAA